MQSNIDICCHDKTIDLNGSVTAIHQALTLKYNNGSFPETVTFQLFNKV